MEYYKILKINANSSKEDIKSAYQSIVEKCHSELVSPHDEKSYNDKMHTLWLANEAYAVLANQKLRNQYNKKLIKAKKTNSQKHSLCLKNITGKIEKLSCRKISKLKKQNIEDSLKKEKVYVKHKIPHEKDIISKEILFFSATDLMERKEYIRAFEIFKSITDNESLAVTPHLIKASECAFFAEEHDFAFFSLHTIIKKCFYHKTEKITAEKDEDLLSHLLNMFYLNFPFCVLDHNRELKKIFDTEKEVRDFFTKDKNINQEVKSNYLYFSAKAYLNLYKIMKNEDYIKTAFEMSRKLKKIKTAKPFLSSLDRELKKLYSKEELATIKLIYS